MARQIDSEITGVIENIIFYERQGEFLMRTVPKQSSNSTRSAKAFGRASSRAKILRQLLAPVIPDPRDKEMQNRLTTSMRGFLAALLNPTVLQPEDNALAGFRFVASSDLKACLKFPLLIIKQADGGLTFEMPAIKPVDAIVAPQGTNRVQLRLLAAGFNQDNDQGYAGSPAVLDIPYSAELQPALSVVLDNGSEAGNLVVVVAALDYWNGNRRICEVGFMGVEIISAFAPD